MATTAKTTTAAKTTTTAAKTTATPAKTATPAVSAATAAASINYGAAANTAAAVAPKVAAPVAATPAPAAPASPLTYLTGAAYASEVIREQANATLAAAQAKVAADVAAGLNPQTTVTNANGTKVQVVTGPTGPAPINPVNTTGPAIAANATPGEASSAFSDFYNQFSAVGLGDMANELLALSKSPNAPTTAAEYYQAMQQLPDYKTKFGDANAARVQNGYSMLSEAQIIANQTAYADAMKNAGMPAGFYDSPADFNNFIANDKSPAEVSDIIQAYKTTAQQQNPDLVNALQTYYNIPLGTAAAMMMDPTAAQPIIDAITNKGTTAAAAAAVGMTNLAGAAQVANAYGAGGLSFAQQTQGFGQANVLNQQVGGLSDIYKGAYGNYNTAQGLQEAFNGPDAAAAAATRQRLATAEESSFGGSAGASQQAQSLGVTGSSGNL